MKDQIQPLTLTSPGKEVRLVSITGGRDLRSRLTDMGLYIGTKLKVLHCYKVGPCIIRVGNTRLVLGHGMAEKILVREE